MQCTIADVAKHMSAGGAGHAKLFRTAVRQHTDIAEWSQQVLVDDASLLLAQSY